MPRSGPRATSGGCQVVAFATDRAAAESAAENSSTDVFANLRNALAWELTDFVH